MSLWASSNGLSRWLVLRGHTDVAAFGDTMKRVCVRCALAKSRHELFASSALLLHHSDAAREASREKGTLQSSVQCSEWLAFLQGASASVARCTCHNSVHEPDTSLQ